MDGRIDDSGMAQYAFIFKRAYKYQMWVISQEIFKIVLSFLSFKNIFVKKNLLIQFFLRKHDIEHSF
jgi:hypothetical protein